MKNVILFSFLLFASFNLFGQDEADASPFSSGTIYLSGASSLNIVIADDAPRALGLGLGYFVADNIMLGASFQYLDFGFGSNTTLELEGRYYIASNLFGVAAYQLDDENTFGLGVGYDIFLSNTVALEPIFTYPFSDFLDPSLGIRVSAFF